jgi:MbtH protein
MEPDESERLQPTTPTVAWLVVVNDDGMFSVCEAGATLPAGWRILGPKGTRDECLRFIDDNLTDMRPSRLWP